MTSSRQGTINYSLGEMQRLNATVRAVRPQTNADWLRVAFDFNRNAPPGAPFREVASLLRKFRVMCSIKGDALASHVLEAKELRDILAQDEEDGERVERTEVVDVWGLKQKLRGMEQKYRRGVEGTSADDGDQLERTEGKRRAVERGSDCHSDGGKKRRVEAGEGEGEDTTRESVWTGTRTGPIRNATVASTNYEEGGELRASGSVPMPLPAGATNGLHVPLAPFVHVPAPSVQKTQTLGVTELLLQFMTTQQMVRAQQLQAEEERRQEERREREARRYQKGLQRRLEHRELMIALAAMSRGRFPDSLKYHLPDEPRQGPTTATRTTWQDEEGESVARSSAERTASAPPKKSNGKR